VNGCQGPHAKEWESLALVGKYALETKSNQRASWYSSEHLNEESIELKLAR
jgi:hypothetical protein